MNPMKKPPASINGKKNSDYTKWWRLEHPDKWREIHSRQTETRRKKEHDIIGCRSYLDESKCVECGLIFRKKDIEFDGHLTLPSGRRGCRIICKDCRI